MKSLKKAYGDMTIRNKLILVFICISFFPFLYLGMFFYNQVQQLINSQERLTNDNFLSQYTLSLDGKLEIYENLSDYIAFNEVIANTLDAQGLSTYDLYTQISSVIDPMLSTVTYFHSDIKAITIYTSSLSIRHDNLIAPVSDLEAKLPGLDLSAVSGDVSWYTGNDSQTIYCIRRMPLLERRGIDGYLYMEINKNALFYSLASKDYTNYYLKVSDPGGQIIYESFRFSADSSFNGYNTSQFQEMESAGNEDFLSKESTISNWTVTFFHDTSDTLSWLRRMGWTSLLWECVLAAIAIVLMDVITKKTIVDRLSRLSGAMQQVQQGHLEGRSQDPFADEIGHLNGAFNIMVSRIKELIEDIGKAKTHEKELELSALQHQINPHFLYNTLSMINFKALEIGERDISRATLALADFYRTSLNKGQTTCRVADEIHNVKAYLEIQQLLHDENFEIDWQLEEDLMECTTINLILQPIVENAILHGLDMVEDERRRRLIVRLFSRGADLIFEVEDNGVGMDAGTAALIVSRASKGYGIRNVNEKIKLYYGSHYGITVCSELNKGTIFTVKIPRTNTFIQNM